MRLPIKGKHVMLTHRVKVDILYDNHLVISFFEDCTIQNFFEISRVSAGEIFPCPSNAMWRAQKSDPFGIFADRFEKRMDQVSHTRIGIRFAFGSSGYAWCGEKCIS